LAGDDNPRQHPGHHRYDQRLTKPARGRLTPPLNPDPRNAVSYRRSLQDQASRADLQRWKERRLQRQPQRLVLESWRERVSEAGAAARERLEALPGADQFEQVFLGAVQGLAGLGSRIAMASVRDGAVVRAYQKRGYPVQSLTDVRELELRDIDSVKPRLDIAYIVAATVEGAGAGFVVSGGEFLASAGTVFGAGAGAAPGAGTVIAAMAADAATVLLAGQRAIAHVAAYYGYDVEEPQERLFALGVLGFGTAAEAGKAGVYAELNKVVQGLARRQTWQQLNEHGVTKIISRVYTMLGFRITQRKLGQAIPVVGIVLGAGLNARLLAKIADDAERLYRERFLREKYGLETAAIETASTDGDTVPLADIIDAEIIAEQN